MGAGALCLRALDVGESRRIDDGGGTGDGAGHGVAVFDVGVGMGKRPDGSIVRAQCCANGHADLPAGAEDHDRPIHFLDHPRSWKSLGQMPAAASANRALRPKRSSPAYLWPRNSRSRVLPAEASATGSRGLVIGVDLVDYLGIGFEPLRPSMRKARRYRLVPCLSAQPHMAATVGTAAPVDGYVERRPREAHAPACSAQHVLWQRQTTGPGRPAAATMVGSRDRTRGHAPASVDLRHPLGHRPNMRR